MIKSWAKFHHHWPRPVLQSVCSSSSIAWTLLVRRGWILSALTCMLNDKALKMMLEYMLISLSFWAKKQLHQGNSEKKTNNPVLVVMSVCLCVCLLFLSTSSSPMGMRLPQAQTTPPAGCLTCVPTRSWWCTPTTTSSAALPRWPSPKAAVCCSPAMTTSTATCGTPSKPTVQVSARNAIDLAYKVV